MVGRAEGWSQERFQINNEYRFQVGVKSLPRVNQLKHKYPTMFIRYSGVRGTIEVSSRGGEQTSESEIINMVDAMIVMTTPSSVSPSYE